MTGKAVKEKLVDFAILLAEMWRESTIIQGVLTLSVIGVWLAMVYTAKPIPDAMNWVVGAVVGFYFGTKNTQSAKSLVKQVMHDEGENI